MEQTTVLTSGSRAVDLVDVPDIAEAEARHAEARAKLEIAEKRLAVDRAALNSANAERSKLISSYRTVKEDAASDEVKRLRGEKPAGTEGAIKKLTEIHARIEISNAVIAAFVEELIPAAQFEQMDCNAHLKDMAADKVDADRWARLRQYSAGLDALAESEGAVEVHPARFEEEGKIALELRGQAVTIRAQRSEYADRMSAMIVALRQARNQA